MRVRILFASLGILLAATFTASGAMAQAKKVTDALNQVAAVNEAQVRASTQVLDRGQSPGIRETAGLLRAHQEEMKAQLKNVADEAGVRELDGGLGGYRRLVEDMDNARGDDLDDLYVRTQVRLYEAKIASLRDLADVDGSPRLREYAQRELDHARSQLKLLDRFRNNR